MRDTNSTPPYLYISYDNPEEFSIIFDRLTELGVVFRGSFCEYPEEKQNDLIVLYGVVSVSIKSRMAGLSNFNNYTTAYELARKQGRVIQMLELFSNKYINLIKNCNEIDDII